MLPWSLQAKPEGSARRLCSLGTSTRDKAWSPGKLVVRASVPVTWARPAAHEREDRATTWRNPGYRVA